MTMVGLGRWSLSGRPTWGCATVAYLLVCLTFSTLYLKNHHTSLSLHGPTTESWKPPSLPSSISQENFSELSTYRSQLGPRLIVNGRNGIWQLRPTDASYNSIFPDVLISDRQRPPSLEAPAHQKATRRLIADSSLLLA